VIPRPNHFLAKPLRSACWALAALLFYALFTRELLSEIALDEEGVSFFSAWIAIGRWIWNEPGKIVHVGYEDFEETMISAFIGAVIGSLPMLVLAIGRKGYLLGSILLLTIPFAWILAIFIQFRIGPGMDHPPPAFVDAHPTLLASGSYFANADLEFFLGFLLPLFGYPFLFGGVVLYLLHWFAFHRKTRPAKDRPDGAES